MSRRTRQFLTVTHSVCPECGLLVPTRVTSDGRDVYFSKYCREHGQTTNLVRRGVEDYLKAQRYVKPAWAPLEFAGDPSSSCPDACGFCERHEQHLCMPIIEITTRCDLACPVCLVNAGRDWDMTLEDYRRLLDSLIRAEKQIDVLNLSGGEPTVHPEFLAFVDEALSRPEIVRVSVSTNGLRLLDRPGLLPELKRRNVVVSLQFDGLDDKAYGILRGRPLLAQKRRVLDLLEAEDVTTSLTMTVAGGVNDAQFGPMLDLLFSRRHVVSLMVQPAAFAGRGAGLAGVAGRVGIPDVVAALGSSMHPFVSAEDFVPLPCSHPLCFSLAFYLMLDEGPAVSVNRLARADAMLDSIANRTVFGLDAEEHERLKELIYELWSGPAGAAPDSEAVIRTLRGILRDMSCCCYDPRKAFTLAERRVKSIFIHAFQDADTFDLARARRCCNAYPQPDGRLVPACVRNVMGVRR